MCLANARLKSFKHSNKLRCSFCAAGPILELAEFAGNNTTSETTGVSAAWVGM